MAGLSVIGGLSPGGLGRPAAAEAPKPTIRPRSDWAGDRGPTGPLTEEAAGDVKFLLVHHTETPNGYAADAVARQLRGMFEFHTGKEKGWPDIAYNFLVDAHGGIWEGRAGSVDGPVKGSATGGSQGFAQLCCFIGNHTSEPPTEAAQQAMSALLAWLAGRYGIDLSAGPTITFVSRGSNKWPAGATVTTDPIAGHRDMSQTECPGDACYPLVRGALLTGAQALAGAAPAPAPTQPTPTESATPPAPADAQPAAAPEPTGTPTSPATSPPASPATIPPPADLPAGGGFPGGAIGVAAVGAVAAVTVGSAVVGVQRWRDRQLSDQFAEDFAHYGEPADPLDPDADPFDGDR